MPDDPGALPSDDRDTPVTGARVTLAGRLIDAVLDVTVVSFAFWTLLYFLGLWTQWSLWPSGLLWAAATLVMLGWRLRSAVAVAEAAPAPVGPGVEGPRRVDLLLVPGFGLVIAAAVGGVLWRPGLFTETWMSLVLGIAVLLVWAWLGGRVRSLPDPAQDEATPLTHPRPGVRGLASWAELGVLALAAGIAALTALLQVPQAGDTHRLNRAVWVAEHGNAALRDTVFSSESLPSVFGTELQFTSIEALNGVIAHHTGLLAGTVTYLVAGPIAGFLAVLALWRLALAWAPRRAFLVVCGALGFVLLSGGSGIADHYLTHLWQGKVIALAVLMPLIWAYLVEAHDAPARRGRRVSVILLLCAGVALLGLTAMAALWAPVMTLAGLAAAAALRSWPLAVGGLALSLGPVAGGAAAKIYARRTDAPLGGDHELLPAWDSFVRVLGEQGPMVALALLGLGLAVVLARRGAPAALAGAVAFGSVLVYAPGIRPLADELTGTGGALWQMLMVAPIPMLVGLLLAVPPVGLPSRPRLGSVLSVVVPVSGALVLVAGLVTGGRPIWSHATETGSVSVSERPEWNADPEPLADVRALVDRGVTGTVLLPPRQMRVLTTYTTRAFPVAADARWIDLVDEHRERMEGRRVLHRLVSGDRPPPDQESVLRAFAALDVTTACVGDVPTRARVLRLFAEAGYTERARVRSLTCADRPE